MSSSLAKTQDGSIQLTFSIPWEIIEEERRKAAEILGKDIEIPGFRKGKAPLSQVLKNIPSDKLLNQSLQNILPGLYKKAVSQHKLKPILMPKFEIISAQEEKDWQIRATTCQMPEFNLGDYKKAVKAIKLADKDKKEKLIIEKLLETINLDIPRLLLENEVNIRLSNLLERIEKLGLTLESYLMSIGKTVENLRKEYEEQSARTLKLELILSKIAEVENIKVGNAELEKFLKTNKISDTKGKQKLILKSYLKKRKVIENLASL